jgi:RNA-binding protein NOB1
MAEAASLPVCVRAAAQPPVVPAAAADAPRPARRILVLDTAAFIAGGDEFFALAALAAQPGSPALPRAPDEHVEFHVVPEVAQEVRDPRARARFELLRDAVVVRAPSAAGMDAVVRFAKATGDYAALSRVDLRVLALAWTAEMEMNGGMFLRDEPSEPVFQAGETISMQQSIALADRELQLEREAQEMALTESGGWVSVKPKAVSTRATRKMLSEKSSSPAAAVTGEDSPASVPIVAEKKKRVRKKRPNRRLNKIIALQKRETGSATSCDPDDRVQDGGAGDNSPCETMPPSPVFFDEDSLADSLAAASVGEDGGHVSATADDDVLVSDTTVEAVPKSDDPSGLDEKEEESFSDDGVGWINTENLEETLGQDCGGQDSSSREKLRVGCVTTDFAMQNVLLQMGINVVSVDGRRTIRRVRRYVLRCHSCTEVTRELERKFCGRCGNASLTRVTFSVDRDGVARIFLSAKFKPRLRGTKYSIPMPRGGRNNKDLILCEDQIDPVKARRLEKQYERRVVDVLDPNTSHSAGRRHDPFRPIVVGYGSRNPNAVRSASKKRK